MRASEAQLPCFIEFEIVGGKHFAEQAEEIARRQRARAVEQIRRRIRRLDGAQMRGDLLDQRERAASRVSAAGASPGEKSGAGASCRLLTGIENASPGPTNTRALSAWRGASRRITS